MGLSRPESICSAGVAAEKLEGKTERKGVATTEVSSRMLDSLCPELPSEALCLFSKSVSRADFEETFSEEQDRCRKVFAEGYRVGGDFKFIYMMETKPFVFPRPPCFSSWTDKKRHYKRRQRKRNAKRETVRKRGFYLFHQLLDLQVRVVLSVTTAVKRRITYRTVTIYCPSYNNVPDFAINKKF
ncbi:hypothetical protein MJG53_008406 [Ovis ammon polii x Ovis aries]|uniref:Uncharacterized protein n=1 Tax=Ovis ammon polii x Ovis aries TaxID=2918886 RepID=A0ACB9V0J9_9CETA|nr:hypothetical protein MJG53_008406 [Ovis ammon polii x Ovis aries]